MRKRVEAMLQPFCLRDGDYSALAIVIFIAIFIAPPGSERNSTKHFSRLCRPDGGEAPQRRVVTVAAVAQWQCCSVQEIRYPYQLIWIGSGVPAGADRR